MNRCGKYKWLMFDTTFVIASTDACLLFDRKGQLIREIARLKEDPTSVFRPDKSDIWLKALIPFIIFLIFISIYLFQHNRKSKQILSRSLLVCPG